MGDKARELLERALDLADYIVGQEKLAEEIRIYLAEENKSDPNAVALQSRCRGDKG